MSVLDVLDATNICAPRLDPTAWAMSTPLPPRRALPVAPTEYSWWSLARNPQALLLTAVITAGLVRDSLAQVMPAR